jgi:single-strand DNA-binding protein
MINLFTFSGWIATDPKFVAGDGGDQSKDRIHFRTSVAKTKRFKEKPTRFIGCTAYGPTARFVNQYLHKGSAVVVSGALDLDEWAPEGQAPKPQDVMTVSQIHSSNEAGERTESSATASAGAATAAPAISDDSLPF